MYEAEVLYMVVILELTDNLIQHKTEKVKKLVIYLKIVFNTI